VEATADRGELPVGVARGALLGGFDSRGDAEHGLAAEGELPAEIGVERGCAGARGDIGHEVEELPIGGDFAGQAGGLAILADGNGGGVAELSQLEGDGGRLGRIGRCEVVAGQRAGKIDAVAELLEDAAAPGEARAKGRLIGMNTVEDRERGDAESGAEEDEAAERPRQHPPCCGFHALQDTRRRGTREYPVVGIEIAAWAAPNGGMTKYLLISALALLCGCRPGVRHGVPLPKPQFTPTADKHAAEELKPGDTPPVAVIIGDPPPEPAARKERKIDEVILSTNADLLDAYFPYDGSGLSAVALAALRKDAALLRPLLAEFPQLRVAVEGHCDERGSAEYNLGLGDRRAGRAAEILQQYGIPAERMETVSYGKEAPQCMEAAESCWSRNRRAHLSVRSGETVSELRSWEKIL